MKTIFFALLITIEPLRAFTVKSNVQMSSNHITNRKYVIEKALLASSAIASCIIAPSFAEVGAFYEKGDELKGAIFATDRAEKIKENYDGVRNAVEVIKGLDLYISDKNYVSIRGALRVPPAALLRKSALNIIPYLDENKKIEAQKKYTQFITSVERLDLLAGQGTKGKTKNLSADLFAEQEKCSKLGTEFLALISKN